MPQKVGNVELYMGPTAVGGPDDLKKVLIDFIDGATRRLDIAIQELDSIDIARAVIRARQRKVAVRLVLEGDYLTVKRLLNMPFESKGRNEANRQIHDAILRSAINVKSDYNPQIFHQKFIVRDGSALLTGSTNFTDTGTSANLNHIVVIRDEKIAGIYGREFREIQQGHFGKLNEGHDASPDDVVVSEIPVRILFAPDHSPEMEIMKQMLKARERIDFAIFTFAKSSGIDDTMVALSKSGLKVRGALDGKQANQKWAATHPVNKAGVELFQIPSQGKLRKLHHKLMVIDRQVVIAGSFNYTGPANRLNDENIVILGALESTKVSSISKQKKLASYASDEIERIINAFGQRMTV
jgi:phosphatidylserine/phosphatidylglycerophosphate/cardiolipin synthase-like enzyme